MNVAILGTRGIPASYSGFETAVEQITQRLTARGHNVTVYCRPHVVDPSIREWKGAKLVHLPTVRNKYLDTFVHTLLSSVHAARRKPDVALFFIAGNSPLCMITRLAGIPTVINVDGLDSDRRKWNRFAKSYLRAAERLSPRMAHRAITDSHAVAAIYESRYGREIGVVPYGAEEPEPLKTDTLDKLGLDPRGYVLFVGRLEPENNPQGSCSSRRGRASRRRRPGARSWSSSAAPRTPPSTSTESAARPTRACSSPATSSAPATGSCRRTPTVLADRGRRTQPVILEALAAGKLRAGERLQAKRRDRRRRGRVLLR